MTAIAGFVRWARQVNQHRLRRRRDQRAAKNFRDHVQRDRQQLMSMGPAWQARQAALRQPPLLSLIWLPDDDATAPAAISWRPLQLQCYPHWELLSDAMPSDALHGNDNRVRCLPAPSAKSADNFAGRFNAMLAQARGDYVLLLRGRDALAAPHSLMMLAEAAEHFDRPPVVYADEDSITDQGQHHAPQFKCEWNQELQRAAHYLGRAYLLRTDLVRAAGGLSELPLPAAEQVLVLTVSEARPDNPAVHVPHLLYSRAADRSRASPAVPAGTAQQAAAVQAHLQRRGESTQVLPCADGGLHVRYIPPSPLPLVSLIVPTRNGLALLRQCMDSLLARTDYPNYEVLIVDNGSDDPATLDYLEAVTADPRVRVRRDARPFNFSALNNHALPDCRGSVIGMLNNDTEVISPGWLCEMVGLACRPDVGAVGARLWFSNRTLQHAGVLLGIGGAAGHAHVGLSCDDPGYLGRARLAQEFSAVTAACMLMRRDVFEAVGGLDEQHLAIDLNDIDLCLKIRSTGLRVIWTPFAELFHHESATRGKPQQPEQQARYQAERLCFGLRWQAWMDADPAYNPNLSLGTTAFAVARRPRLRLDAPWFEQVSALSASPPRGR